MSSTRIDHLVLDGVANLKQIGRKYQPSEEKWWDDSDKNRVAFFADTQIIKEKKGM